LAQAFLLQNNSSCQSYRVRSCPHHRPSEAPHMAMTMPTLATSNIDDNANRELVAKRDAVDVEVGAVPTPTLTPEAQSENPTPVEKEQLPPKNSPGHWSRRPVKALQSYLIKWKGVPGKSSPARATYHHILWSFVGAFVGICMLAFLNFNTPGIEDTDLVMMIGSFGATAVLAYAEPASPLSQPRNIVGGHTISAAVGVSVRLLWEATLTANEKWLACGLAVALAINAMQITKTVHPPAGATSLIAITGSVAVRNLGYWYVLMPAGSGALLMLTWALVVNNMSSARSYPVWWI